MLNKSQELMQASKIKLLDGEPYFNGSVFKIEGKTLLKFTKLKLKKGKRYWLNAPPGAGKTTFFRVLAGIWPLGDGQFSRPKNTVFIPQMTVILPGNQPLINNIVAQIKAYDPTFKLTEQNVQSIKTIMSQMNLSQNIITHLQDCEWKVNEQSHKANWNKALSGGERACINLMALFFIEPETIILDEPFAAIDKKTRSMIQNHVIKKFPDVTLIFTHHGDLGIKNFCDRKLIIDNDSKEVRIACSS